METAKQAGQITWSIFKLIGQMILNHLPYFLIWVSIGFVVGIIAGIIALKVSKKYGVFSRPATGSFSKFLNKAYKPLMFLSILFLSLVFFTHMGVTKVVEKEVHHGVESAFTILEEVVLEDEETRQIMYEMAESVAIGGHYVADFNQAVGEATSQAINEEKHHGFLMSKLTNFIVIESIADKLLEFEKAIVYFATSKIIEASGISDGLPFSDETFDKGVDRWMKDDFAEDIIGIENIISDFIYGQLKPFIFSIFIPFLFGGFVVMIIPIIHLWISKRRLIKISATEVSVPPGND